MNTIKLIASIVFPCLYIMACVHFESGPHNNEEFGQIESLKDIEGVYLNLGEWEEANSSEWDENSYHYYLSRIIWPKNKNLSHENIHTLGIVAVAKNKLKVTAYTKLKEIIKTSIFVEGDDFHIKNGYLKIYRNFGGTLGFGGEQMAGVYYEKKILGIDESGHGKYRRNSAVTGAAFLIIPFALWGHEDVRFKKIIE